MSGSSTVIPRSSLQNAGQIAHNALRDLGLVHRVDMDSIHAIGKQVDDLLRRIGNTRVEHCVRTFAEAVDDCLESAWQVCPRYAADAGDLLSVGDGHDAGNDRHGDAAVAQLREVAVEDVVVEEHLRRDKVEPCFDLLAQIGDVVLYAARYAHLSRNGSARPEDQFH